MKLILKQSDPISEFKKNGGGKATNMARLSQEGMPVPPWFCVTSEGLQEFIQIHQLASLLTPSKNLAKFAQQIETLFLAFPFSHLLKSQIEENLSSLGLKESFVAVRSSGLEEDSEGHSFAGQFSSFLYQKGMSAISESVVRCWASGYSERAMSYRINRGLPVTDLRIGVVIQLMANADTAGVAFSRNPIRPLDRDHMIISSVWGLGEGLVSGELDADHFEVNRSTLHFKPKIVNKTHGFFQSPQGGFIKKLVPLHKIHEPSLTSLQIKKISELTLLLENKFESPQDCEWAIEGENLFLLQTRPITNLPKDPFFDASINGSASILWDNSNIIESYSGVTSPLTFSFASSAYRQVYIQFCEIVGVPRQTIQASEPMFRNMLGLIRGRIYYNLIYWYRLVLMLPGTSHNKAFMDTMMGIRTGVQQKIKPEVAEIFSELENPPQYSFLRKFSVRAMTLYRFIRIDTIIAEFQEHFNRIYEESRNLPFSSMSLTDLAKVYQKLDEQILRRWHAPIINDYLCMIFFGLLKSLTEKWVSPGNLVASLQNDLLCGQGDLESTEPTKELMRIAEQIDKGPSSFRNWFITSDSRKIWTQLNQPFEVAGLGESAIKISQAFDSFLDRFGFRCINELKLEESDLHDDPTFVIQVVASYVKMKSYSIQTMEDREKEIRAKAEAIVQKRIFGLKSEVYFWVLKHSRKAVKNRENLRFARTKIFGVTRHLFRGMGSAMVKLGILTSAQDIFYLTVEEIIAFVEGRSVSLQLGSLVSFRKLEYQQFRQTPAPPDRMITTGAAGLTCAYPQVLFDADLLKDDGSVSTDPNILTGTPCCPGIIEGFVRVVESVQDASGIRGEILVTARTDPGWVPLFPSCSGLLIERGSLLSHSAVVARELGLPTIVGISGGLMKKLKSGQRVRIDAGKGEVRILE